MWRSLPQPTGTECREAEAVQPQVLESPEAPLMEDAGQRPPGAEATGDKDTLWLSRRSTTIQFERLSRAGGAFALEGCVCLCTILHNCTSEHNQMMMNVRFFSAVFAM